MSEHGPDRQFLRHTLAVLAYRGAKALRGAPDGFGSLAIGKGSRTPAQILAHVGDLLEWALLLARGVEGGRVQPPRAWEEDTARFFDCLRLLDDHLASDAPLACPAERVFQGPIADAIAHVGQLAMLRRLAGSPVRGENYFVADITTGRVGPDQAPPRREFD